MRTIEVTFVLYLTPLVSITYLLFNITMTRLTPQEMEEERKAEDDSHIETGQEAV